MTFRGWIVRESDDSPRAQLEELDESLLPDLDTVVRVSYSGINYKDALALQGRPGCYARFRWCLGLTWSAKSCRHDTRDGNPEIGSC